MKFASSIKGLVRSWHIATGPKVAEDCTSNPGFTIGRAAINNCGTTRQFWTHRFVGMLGNSKLNSCGCLSTTQTNSIKSMS